MKEYKERQKKMTEKEKIEKKLAIEKAQAIKKLMTPEQKIEMLNTKYNDLPEELKAGMVKRPQQFKFIPMTHRKIGEQRETFGARLIRYRQNWHLSRENFCDIANEFAKAYGVKITLRDMSNYEDFNVCPKIDKMTAISQTMDLPIEYFAGYGPVRRKPKKVA